MFVAIAVVVYTTILLYIGVKVLFGVSTPRQGEYKKDLTNWVVGLVLLFVVPQFFKFIPSMVNSVVSYIGGSSRIIMYSYYNMDNEILKGMNSEEVDSVSMDSEKIGGADGAAGEDTRSAYIETLKGLRAGKQTEYEKVKEHIKTLEELLNALNDQEPPSMIERLRRAVKKFMYLKEYNAAKEEEKALEDGIAKLTALIDAPDLMGDMRVLAGQTGRFTYAVVWWICIYEMIVILCMYYRRVIVMGILITIYPLVAMTYPIDKLKDGKAQTLTNWYKEFTVNLVVQIVHAVVYIVLVQSGIKLYQANANNWLFFILAVLFLFPAERLMRGIFGLKGTSIKELKANAVGIAGAAATAVTLGKQTGRAANEKFGITKKGKEAKANKQKAADKAKKNRDNRDKYLQGRADIKENLRKQKAAQRRRRAASMHGSRRMAYNLYAKTMNAANRARSAAYKLGNKGRKLKGKYRKLQDSNLAKYAKGTWRVARGATGMAVGAANFVTTSGTSGLGAGFVSGTSVARMVGGFKDRDRLQKAIDNRASSQTANTSQNASAGSGGSNGGSAPRTTPRVNVPPSVSGAPGPNNGGTSANSGSPQVKVNTTTTQNINTQTNN